MRSKKNLFFLPNGLGDLLLLLPSLRRSVTILGIENVAVVVAGFVHQDLIKYIFGNKLKSICRNDGKLFSQLRLLLAIIFERYSLIYAPLVSNKKINKLFFILTFTPTIFPNSAIAGNLLNIKRSAKSLNSFNGHQVNYFANFIGVEHKGGSRLAVSFDEMRLSNKNIMKEADCVRSNPASDVLIAIGLSCGSSERHKIPKPEFFSNIVNKLSRSHSTTVFLFGLSEDLKSIFDFKKRLNAEIKVVEYLNRSIPDVVDALSNCDIGVAGTTGQGHMMAAAGLPLLILSGVTDPYESGPYTKRAHVLKHRYECGPCYQEDFLSGCGKINCMDTLDADEAVVAIKRLHLENAYGINWLDDKKKSRPLHVKTIKSIVDFYMK